MKALMTTILLAVLIAGGVGFWNASPCVELDLRCRTAKVGDGHVKDVCLAVQAAALLAGDLNNTQCAKALLDMRQGR